MIFDDNNHRVIINFPLEREILIFPLEREVLRRKNYGQSFFDDIIKSIIPVQS